MAGRQSTPKPTFAPALDQDRCVPKIRSSELSARSPEGEHAVRAKVASEMLDDPERQIMELKSRKTVVPGKMSRVGSTFARMIGQVSQIDSRYQTV